MGSGEASSGKKVKTAAEKEGEQIVKKKILRVWTHKQTFMCQQVYGNCPCVWPKPQQMQILSQ